MLHWTWLLARQSRNGSVAFEEWILWTKLALLDTGLLVNGRLLDGPLPTPLET